LDCPSISTLCVEDTKEKLNIHMLSRHLSENVISKGTYPTSAALNQSQYITSRMTIFNCETTDAHGWHAGGSNSWYVAR
jgi:hypothetical protein